MLAALSLFLAGTVFADSSYAPAYAYSVLEGQALACYDSDSIRFLTDDPPD